jgi:hypothetical protein
MTTGSRQEENSNWRHSKTEQPSLTGQYQWQGHYDTSGK